MTPSRGYFPFCNAPVLTGGQQAEGNYQVPYFWNEAEDAYLNVKNYNFSLNVVQDILDADIALLQASAITIAGGLIGPGGALAGFSIGSEFLAPSADRIGITATTTRIGYCDEMVPPTAVYDATGSYTLAVNRQTFYFWNPSTNEILAKNGTQLLLPGKKFLSQGNTITLRGAANKPVTASVVARGVRDIYAQNLCLMTIDWGSVARSQIGSKQGINGVLYYPQVAMLFYAGGYFLATDVSYLAGAGSIIGGIDVTNAVGTITNVNALTSAGPPVGQPSMFGQIAPNERYDALSWKIAKTPGSILGIPYGSIATFTGITFDNMAPDTNPTMGASPVQGVFLGSIQLPYSVSADMKTLTAYLPSGLGFGYVTFKTTKRDSFSTRIPIYSSEAAL